jgi:anti-anti-sigma factor
MDTPYCCPACGGEVVVGPSSRAGDAPCPHCGHLLWFVRKSAGAAAVLTFLPGLMAGSESVTRINEVLAACGDFSRVVLDLSPLRFLSSMFLAMLVVLHKRVVSAGGTLRICGVQPDAAKVFKITKLDTIFDLCPDEQTALQSPCQPPRSTRQ